MSHAGFDFIQTQWVLAARQHGYSNAIVQYQKPPYPVTERDCTGMYGYYPPPESETKFGGRQAPRPEHQRPLLSRKRNSDAPAKPKGRPRKTAALEQAA